MTSHPEWMGLVLAGGASRRFGSDKALAEVDGVTLLDHSANALARICDTVAVAGRESATYETVADRPSADLGPLGGLCGGLHEARQRGFTHVLSCGVDSFGLPDDLAELLSPGPACLAAQPVVGLWPVSLLERLEDYLTHDPRRSVRGFVEAVGARRVECERPPANINRPEDLEDLD